MFRREAPTMGECPVGSAAGGRPCFQILRYVHSSWAHRDPTARRSSTHPSSQHGNSLELVSELARLLFLLLGCLHAALKRLVFSYTSPIVLILPESKRLFSISSIRVGHEACDPTANKLFPMALTVTEMPKAGTQHIRCWIHSLTATRTSDEGREP
ncbi:uncharacterized protein B0T15DRAFT_542852 [Chaetomium strumarium]|uniref:Uncharacterized protein n=1 Tax=Chaetomium strumarium TaxID=1170767 RepID=A0AAJ0GLY8_9PEZI|nr:hypothetical protein B0T15DRAFT_542852 [Chaetomium strumarium]